MQWRMELQKVWQAVLEVELELELELEQMNHTIQSMYRRNHKVQMSLSKKILQFSKKEMLS